VSAKVSIIVCDTDVASFILKPDPTRGPRYARHVEHATVVLAFCTVAELRLGAELRNWGADRRARMEQFISDCDVHYTDDALCTAWSGLIASRRRVGRPMAPHDAWIAATALYLQVPLITHNAGHFADTPGLVVITEPDA
jgi:tRNA(fMet)-specific endonuclease VapC